MSLQFKKPQKKNLRQRLDEDGDPEEEMEVDSVSAFDIKKGKKKKKKEKPDVEKPKQTLLSFDDELHEDEGEIFQVKKSSQSKRLARQLDKERRKRKEQEKQGNNKTQIKQERNITPPPAPEITKEKMFILNGREAEFAQQRSDTDEEETEMPRFSRPKHLKQVLESGCIPDAAMIHAARKSRQKARELGGDYIPIAEEKKSTENNSNSRIEHDEDGSDEGEGEEGSNENQRIDFTVDTTAKEQERRREAFFAAQEETGEHVSDQEDDELENWEAQQIRKAVTGAQLAAAQQEVMQQNSVSYVRDSAGRYQYPNILPALQIKQEPVVEQVLAQMPVKTEAPTVEELTRLLRERLSSLRETQRRHILDRERAQAELVEIGKESENLQASETERSRKFQFYQDLRGYVTDLVECFNEKMPSLEQIEQRAVALYAKKTSQLVDRRRQDTKDQAAEAAALTRPAGTLIEQDEARVRRAAEREGRRSRRRRARESRPSSSDSPAYRHYEGLSSDDEQTDLEVASLGIKIEQIEKDAHLLFDDVIDEFSVIPTVMQRFEKWKRKDIDSYQEAYVHLSLPKIFSLLIRLQLITWNPIEDNITTLETSSWFQTLATYSLSIGEKEEDLAKDPDVNLLPLVIELSVLPKLSKLIVEAWDPCSTSQTQRLVVTLRHILTEYPMLASRGRMSKSLLPALADKLRDSVDSDVFIPIYPARPAAVVGFFFQRQFWSAVKLLRNLLQFRGILGDSTLQEFALAALLGRYLLAALRTCDPLDALDKCKHLLAVLPKAWVQREPQFIQLQMFQTQVMNIVKAIDVTNPGGRDALVEALSILRALGAKTKAEELGKIYL